MKRLVILALSLAASSILVSAQSFARDGWEAFPDVEYQGGDTTHPKKREGMLVLTETTLALHPCREYTCRDKSKTKPPFDERFVYFTIPLADITAVENTSQVRGPDAVQRFAFGIFAADHANDYLNVVYKTATDVQAPVFKTSRTQAAALVAKLRFRIQKATPSDIVP